MVSRLEKTMNRMKRRFLVAVAIMLAAAALTAARGAALHPLVVLELGSTPAPTSLPVPVDGVRARQIADTWGGPRSGGRKHQGVDIFAPRGTIVRSTTRGLVVRRGTVNLGGQAVSILGPGLVVHYYAHLDAFGSFELGDVVNEGDILGYVGDTGNAQGTPFHLHYGVYVPTRGAVNPWPMLKDRRAGS
jgi:murein DD-endopeptidase MepM/ murein hydrolase activator NlpD